MAVLPIRIYGDPVLRQKAEKVSQVDSAVIRLVQDMFDTLRQASGLGLAANQVGSLKRVFIIDLSKVIPSSKPVVFINPVMLKSEGEQVGEEGCLSIPGIYEDVPRFKQVTFSAQDLSGKEFTLEAMDLLARVMQHELDHLNGTLFIDRLSEVVRTNLASRLKQLQPIAVKGGY
jgi:peptide deformylase